ncbi:MAG: sigma-70 family RNA polymerase sigma factor [Lentisphaerae bacterium]|nr:sigma-70 family RNA polymerase sigma factor [Lentisphaerota bacterium]MBT4822184.1 sigma-70 family RNA polymerase sigma factor [Lentisphaerota bacterium]MBT5610374.1 sigma-70 family RNA polymerase sigma factor [Lentisphaerota bacterium]MBT7056202.1 sigma-70 family RNA polymerase sigma factor [Lentisphaerota bacterium]MBT7841876.1 sigma-70 family RNA polymerase sigma factor [Lentisphaerota bacterium]
MSRFRLSLDEYALEALVERHAARATSVATGLLADPSGADDAVQEAFISLVRQRMSFDPKRSFAAWFYTILRNKCRDLNRKHLRTIRKHGRLADEPIARGVTPHAQEAVRLLQELPEAEREVLALKFIHGLSVNEIATHLGCSAEAAKKRAQRALVSLRHQAQEALAPGRFAAAPGHGEPRSAAMSRNQTTWNAWPALTDGKPAPSNATG